jgi:tetratricopeptide (TPR) repeat protein/DNA-binding transcriptional ArsR family regulator
MSPLCHTRPVRAASADVHEAAAQALARGDALRALGSVGRAEDALGLTLRGIAYAQLGDLERARTSLERATKLTKSPLGRARIQAALTEIAMSDGDPARAARAARASADELARLGDARNAAMQRLVVARAEVLLGRLAEARHVVSEVLAAPPASSVSPPLPPDVLAVAWLAKAEIAVRAVAATEAREALKHARAAMAGAPNELLARALVALEAELSKPVARLEREGVIRNADLYAIEAASTGALLLVDACRRIVIGGRASVPLARRPVLFALLLVLARALPRDVARDELAARAFDVPRVNASHRSRLRVEIGRLRKLLAGIAEPVATADGYKLASSREVITLLPPSEDDDARIAILMSDGAAWSAQALAEHAGVSKRTVQRALAALVDAGGTTRSSHGKEVRYTRAGPPIAARMLLLGLVPSTARR